MINFYEILTERKTEYQRMSYHGKMQTISGYLLVPKRKFEGKTVFENFEFCTKREADFDTDFVASRVPNPISVHENFLNTKFAGRWTAKITRYQHDADHRYIVGGLKQLTFYFEKSEDALSAKMAGLFTGANKEQRITPYDREKTLVYRTLQFSITERRRLLRLLRDSDHKVDQQLLKKIL